MSSNEKTAVETAEELVPRNTSGGTSAELVPQPHGGALARGGYRGNKGGGRPPSAIREAFRRDLETAHLRIVELLDDPHTKPSDIISIFDKLAKYALGGGREAVEMTPEIMNELGAVVARLVTAEADRRVIKDEWTRVLRRHLR